LFEINEAAFWCRRPPKEANIIFGTVIDDRWATRSALVTPWALKQAVRAASWSRATRRLDRAGKAGRLAAARTR
jgi:hypothetical protein